MLNRVDMCVIGSALFRDSYRYKGVVSLSDDRLFLNVGYTHCN
jgi:hypothetical protein